ncbi:YvcK family protein [Metallumcola ferriviriculae]|uniref:Putative gluconeogenesis factor n=1 Tax=Metallumcola ferriviriculae TaxID=3039180 RepID=A0AAU0UL88_9FIRM|nr:YvcK family protein [Desulfitibacteraceae bacterium MK1]
MNLILKWLYPGLGVKRWILLAVLGIILLGTGIAVLLDFTIWFQLMQTAGTTAIGYLGGQLSRFFAILTAILGLIFLIISLRRLVQSLLLGFLPGNENKVVEILYHQRRLKQGPKITAIGGGTGLSVLLRGLKKYTSNLTAVVTVSDNGGSSGRLRGELGILPPGDARNCLVALADTESLMEEMFNYRFDKGALEGHSLGNLLLAAMTDITGNFDSAVQEISKVLAVRGQVFPSTLCDVGLKARMTDGSWVNGETELVEHPGKIERIFLEPHDAEVLPEVLRQIAEADAVVLGPGSLYTSIIPNLLLKGMISALQKTKAPVFYVCNVMTQPGETDGYTVADHVRAINYHTGASLIDYVLINNREVSPQAAAKYSHQQSFPVIIDEKELMDLDVILITDELIDDTAVVRHQHEKLARRLVKEIFRANSMVERLRMLNAYLGHRLKGIGEDVGG